MATTNISFCEGIEISLHDQSNDLILISKGLTKTIGYKMAKLNDFLFKNRRIYLNVSNCPETEFREFELPR